MSLTKVCIEKIMFLPLNCKMFEVMFEVKSDSLEPVLKHYDVEAQALHDLLWKEFHIPGMELRIANTAFDFLIDCCEEKRDLCETLKGEIKQCVLMASIYYTNIAPNAVSTAEFAVES